MVMMQVMAGGARTATFPRPTPGRERTVGSSEASPLIGADDDQVAVTIEPASGDQP